MNDFAINNRSYLLTRRLLDDRKGALFDRAIMGLFLIYVVSYHIFSFKVESSVISEVILAALIASICLYILIKPSIFIGQQYLLFMAFLLFWAAMTYFWAPEKQVSFDKILTLAQLCFVSSLIYIYIDSKEKVERALTMVAYSFIALAVYTVYVYGFTNLFNGKILVRIGSDISQINVLGMSLSTGAIMCFYYAFYKNKSMFYILCVLLVLLSALTGSRKSFVALIVGLLFLLYMKDKSKKIVRTLSVTLMCGVAVYFILRLPMFQLVLARMGTFFDLFTNKGNVDHSTILRSNMISLGWDLFLKSPMTGYGYDSFRYFWEQESGKYTYSHNNYIEMLVNGGIIAFVSYYGIYVHCLFKLFKITDKTATILIALLLVHLTGDIAVVSYYSKITYVYLAISYAYIVKENAGSSRENKHKKKIAVLSSK